MSQPDTPPPVPPVPGAPDGGADASGPAPGTSTGAPPAVVGPYLADQLGDPRWADCRVDLIAGGKSNLTYLVSSAAGEVVLRRPPLGHVLPTAHDMVREARIMSALAPTAVPVPRVLHLGLDESVLGAPFYLMAKVDGLVCRESLPAGYADAPAQRRAVADGLVRTLADLHEVDPPAVGLGDFGRPDGFLARQVSRWSRQWEASRTEANPALDALAVRLAADVPAAQRAGIVHGDYRLDNTMLDPREPGRVAAVLDWELSALGDPLADLGLLLVYWSEPGDAGGLRGQSLVVPSATALPGFPGREEVAALYAERSGLDLDRLPWYTAFGFFKLAVVCAGIVARVQGGAMVGDGFDDIAGRIDPLVSLGTACLDESRVV